MASTTVTPYTQEEIESIIEFVMGPLTTESMRHRHPGADLNGRVMQLGIAVSELYFKHHGLPSPMKMWREQYEAGLGKKPERKEPS